MRGCKPAATLQRVPELPEGSGLAASRRTPGRFWSHNDSGEPVLFALDGNGRVTGRLSISGATVEDWEAVAVGPCPSGSCIYVADIGDNDEERERITLYRTAEPADASGSAKVIDALHATYPDGSHDAETLLVTPEGRLMIVTKGDTGPVSLYRFPNELRSGTTLRLRPSAQPLLGRDRIDLSRRSGPNGNLATGIGLTSLQHHPLLEPNLDPPHVAQRPNLRDPIAIPIAQQGDAIGAGEAPPAFF